MAILRITLNSWRDLGQSEPTALGAEVGSLIQPATARITPTIQGGGFYDGTSQVRSLSSEETTITGWPWSYDLADPVTEGGRPEGFGYIIQLQSNTNRRAVLRAVLTPEALREVPVVAGVRSIPLEEYIKLATGDVAIPLMTAPEWSRSTALSAQYAAAAESAAAEAALIKTQIEQILLNLPAT